MKFTQYFLTTRQRPDRVIIRLEWIEYVMTNPIKEEIQADGRIKLWAGIPDHDHRYLRVIFLPDRETVHNVFFDRSFKL